MAKVISCGALVTQSPAGAKGLGSCQVLVLIPLRVGGARRDDCSSLSVMVISVMPSGSMMRSLTSASYSPPRWSASTVPSVPTARFE